MDFKDLFCFQQSLDSYKKTWDFLPFSVDYLKQKREQSVEGPDGNLIELKANKNLYHFVQVRPESNLLTYYQ